MSSTVKEVITITTVAILRNIIKAINGLLKLKLLIIKSERAKIIPKVIKIAIFLLVFDLIVARPIFML